LSTARAGRLARNELVSAACRITIMVSGDEYRGSARATSASLEHFPLMVDVPDITLQGAFVMGLDGAGRATGDAIGGSETTLTPVDPLPVIDGSSTPIIVANAHPG